MRLIQHTRRGKNRYYRFFISEEHHIVIETTGDYHLFVLDELPGIYDLISRYELEDIQDYKSYFVVGDRRMEEIKRHFAENEEEYRLTGVFLPECEDLANNFNHYFDRAMRDFKNRQLLKNLDGEGYK